MNRIEMLRQLHGELTGDRMGIIVNAFAHGIGRRGVCEALKMLGLWSNYTGDAILEWPGHSEDVLYPVPCKHLGPRVAFARHSDRGAMWEGEYGTNRLRLLQHLIDTHKDWMMSPYKPAGYLITAKMKPLESGLWRWHHQLGMWTNHLSGTRIRPYTQRQGVK